MLIVRIMVLIIICNNCCRPVLTAVLSRLRHLHCLLLSSNAMLDSSEWLLLAYAGQCPFAMGQLSRMSGDTHAILQSHQKAIWTALPAALHILLDVP